MGDRRGVELVLTDAGYAEIVRTAPTHIRSVRANLVEPLSRDQFIALGRTMAAIGRGIQSSGAIVDDVLTAEEQPA